MVEGLYRGE